MRDGQGKIFCIGLPRTGTTSFRTACTMIGLRVMGDPLGQDLIKSLSSTGTIPDDRYDDNDVFADVVISAWWVELSRAYPAAKFVLTTRRPFDWYESMRVRFREPQAELLGVSFPRDRAAGLAATMTIGATHPPWLAVCHEQEVHAQLPGNVLHVIPLDIVDRCDMTATMCALTDVHRTHSTPHLDPWPHVNKRIE